MMQTEEEMVPQDIPQDNPQQHTVEWSALDPAPTHLDESVHVAKPISQEHVHHSTVKQPGDASPPRTQEVMAQNPTVLPRERGWCTVEQMGKEVTPILQDDVSHVPVIPETVQHHTSENRIPMLPSDSPTSLNPVDAALQHLGTKKQCTTAYTPDEQVETESRSFSRVQVRAGAQQQMGLDPAVRAALGALLQHDAPT